MKMVQRNEEVPGVRELARHFISLENDGTVPMRLRYPYFYPSHPVAGSVVNNTEKLDGIRQRLRVIEGRLNVIQRVNVIVFERVGHGRGVPPELGRSPRRAEHLGRRGHREQDEFRGS
jgi:hypothetical protein